MIGGVMPSGNDNSRDNSTTIIAMKINIGTNNKIKLPAKQHIQHNIVIQKPFLHLLRFSLPQSVFAILTIAIIIKTRLAIENMLPSVQIIIPILKEKTAKLLG